jgi:predicted small secreted protein
MKVTWIIKQNRGESMTMKRLISLLTVSIVALLLTACGTNTQQQLPEYVKQAPHTVQVAYQFAMEHPDMLTHQPCYCGCGVVQHTSVLDCFVRGFDASGDVVFDRHGAGCGICVDIVLDVKRLTEQGWSQLEIRRYIDSTYSVYGPPTDAPMPEA